MKRLLEWIKNIAIGKKKFMNSNSKNKSIPNEKPKSNFVAYLINKLLFLPKKMYGFASSFCKKKIDNHLIYGYY